MPFIDMIKYGMSREILIKFVEIWIIFVGIEFAMNAMCRHKSQV